MNCLVGGTAQIYVDSLFMSNQVTPATIDDHPLDLCGGPGDSGFTITSPALATMTSTSHASNTNTQPTGILTVTHEPATSDTGPTRGEQVGTETEAVATHQQSSQVGIDSSSQTLSRDATESGSQLGTQATSNVESQRAYYYKSESTSPETQAHTSREPAPTDPTTQKPLSTESHSAVSSEPTTESKSIGAETNTPPSIPSTSVGSSSSREISTLKPDGPVSRVCANVGQSTIAGRGCGMRPYNSAGSYTMFTSRNYEPEDCAAVCRTDTNCKSFEWSYNGNCFNDCRLISSPWSDVLSGNSGSQFTLYDRSCIIPKPCYQFPKDSICINKMADTPNSGCLRRRGTLKSCAKEFATLTQGNCKLFSGTTNEITDEGGSEYFSDIGCFARGKNMGFSTCALPIDDAVVLPDMTCRAPTKQVSDTPTTLQTRTSQAVGDTTSQASEYPTSQSFTTKGQPTTTESSPSSTSGVKICPSGMTPPGICKAKENLPTQTVSLPGILDHWPKSDSDIEPAVQRTCNAFGEKKGGWWGNTVQYNHRQKTMEDCALLCRQLGNCEAFGLDDVGQPGVTQCALATYKLATEGINIGVEYPIMWSDLDCYECEECVAE
ncbi:hypothetical protein ACHAPU_011067 [Fusarium lateritium]